MREYTFLVRILGGQHFPREVNNILLCLTFGGESQFKTISKGVSKTTWSSALELTWVISAEKLRNITNSGTTSCKLTCSDVGSGAPLGWVVLDLRTAKLNANRKDTRGEVFILTGSSQQEKTGSAQLQIFHSFQERSLTSAQGTTDAEVSIRKSVAAGSDEMRHSQDLASACTGFAESPPQVSALATDERPGECKDATLQDGISNLSGGNDVEPSELFRRFRMAVDLRSLQAYKSLPVNLASVFVQAFLPKDIKGIVSRGNRTPFPTPLKTFPSTDVSRGSEVALPNGYASIEFSCDVMTLASSLAAEPHMTIEIWHKERLKKDMMLGVASVPLAVLLQEPWVDRYAAVYARVSYPGEDEKKVQVAAVRVVLSLEELGLAAPPAPLAPHPLRQSTGRAGGSERPRGKAAPEEQQHAVGEGSAGGHTSPGEEEHPKQGEGAVGDQETLGPSAEEIQAAFELEVWKREAEKQWREELRAREEERLSILEAEWRNRESLRDAEFSARREAYSKLESRAREVLKDMASREAKLVAAEESLASRRAELERAAAARISEAEAAVRRLQVECEHQLELERHRNEELARSRTAAEERARSAQARADAVEAAFEEYRDSQRHTDEARLQSQLREVQDALRAAEERARVALEGKARYRQQVGRLVAEIRELKSARASEQQQLLSRLDEISARRAIGGRVAAARTHGQELQLLRRQLDELRAATAKAAGDGEDPAAGSAAAEGKENLRPPQRQKSPGSPKLAPVRAEIARLEEERRALTGTGMYEEGDPLIAEIDRQLEGLRRAEGAR
uniref:Centrosomal protein CEP120 n=1 Tax=Tetraselmis sp. GSL018 TaxID=582737 RepID=A0A061QYS2_9CHLO|eukprot:CAMPEP_0177602860 /NCGR_PEP_ID=MMETSP0419_2-20121207/15150_1 /TAXON_ID=582737 /ORGANISM="Tetraselmis sp., Strain GSL018" /LENGTH=796 /DNA_ID=CAMNT_0019096485 /DNA_START=121 /DNA_END=2511 /DNA_ORIENTATION=+